MRHIAGHAETGTRSDSVAGIRPHVSVMVVCSIPPRTRRIAVPPTNSPLNNIARC